MDLMREMICVHVFAGVTTAGRVSSVMNVCFIPDASTGPAPSPGSAIAIRTGVASCAIKVWKTFFNNFLTSHTRR